MFATDYPHGHNEGLSQLLAAGPPGMRLMIMRQSAIDWYRL
jgi:uncharacterized protein